MAVGPLPAVGSPPSDSLPWPTVQLAIEQHRQLVRMCGPLSAVRLIAHSGRQVNRGVAIGDVLKICRQHDVSVRAVRGDPDNLRWLRPPAILLVNEGQHCVVLESIDLDQIELWDPSDLKVKRTSLAALRRIWDGEAIVTPPLRYADAAWTLATCLLLVIVGNRFLYRQTGVDHDRNNLRLAKVRDRA